MIDYSLFSQLAAARASIISGPDSRSAHCFQFLHSRAKFGLGVIWLSEVRVGGRVAASGRGRFWWVGFSPLQFSVPKGTGETGDWRNTSDLGATAFSSCPPVRRQSLEGDLVVVEERVIWGWFGLRSGGTGNDELALFAFGIHANFDLQHLVLDPGFDDGVEPREVFRVVVGTVGNADVELVGEGISEPIG